MNQSIRIRTALAPDEIGLVLRNMISLSGQLKLPIIFLENVRKAADDLFKIPVVDRKCEIMIN